MPTSDIPNYSVEFYSEKQFNYCVVIFVINEGEKLHKQLARMQACEQAADIVVSDGGSSDGSVSPSVLQNFNVNTLLVKQDTGKLGSQMRIAFHWALSRGYEGVVVIDGNNKDSVEDIPDFVQKLKEGFDHVQGSRFVPGGHEINTPISRLIGLKLLHAPLIRIASGFNYTDTTNGFRAYSARLLQSPKISVFRRLFRGYELHYHLAIEAARQGFKCVEIPVTRTYPQGKVPTKISPLKGNLTVIAVLFKACLGVYRAR